MADPPDADPVPLERIRAAGGDALVARLVALLLDTAPQRLTTAATSLAIGDHDALMLAVHSLKSSCAQLGAMRASSHCAAAEHCLTTGNIDAISAHLAAAQESLGRYRAWIRARGA